MGPESVTSRSAYYDWYFSLSDELFVVASFDGYFVDLNDRWSDVLGFAVEELKAKPFIEFVHGDDREKFGMALAASGESGKVEEMDVRTLTREGTWRDLRATFCAVPEHKVYVGTGRDVTEAKKLEAALERFRLFFQTTLDLACLTNFQGYFVELNPQWQAVLRWTPEELKSKPFLEFVHPDDREATLAEVAKLQTGAKTINFENRYMTRTGAYRWLRWVAAPDERRERLVASARDVTELRESEMAAATLAAIVQSTDDAIIGRSLDGVITTWNPGAERLFGYSESETLGRTLEFLAPQGRARDVTDILAAVQRGESVKHLATIRRRRDGSPVDVYVTASPILGADGSIVGVATMRRDVSESKKIYD